MSNFIEHAVAELQDYKKIKFLEYYVNAFDCYVAGGCFKDLFENKRPKDIDLFFKDVDSFEKALTLIKENERFELVSETGTSTTFYDNVVCLNIQLIKNYTFKSSINLLNDFDFTVTKCVLYLKDGQLTILKDKDFNYDLSHKTLRFERDLTAPVSTFLRVFRYIDYGFKITDDSIRNLGASLGELDPDDEELVQLYYED